MRAVEAKLPGLLGVGHDRPPDWQPHGAVMAVVVGVLAGQEIKGGHLGPRPAQSAGEFAPSQGRRLARWIGINAWQPFSPPPYDIPLAICDTRTLAPQDVVIGRGSVPSMRELELDLPLFAWNPVQRCYYYSAFEPDETLLFVGIDSAGQENWRLVPHSAFDGPAGGNPRCSVEMRCMALFF